MLSYVYIRRACVKLVLATVDYAALIVSLLAAIFFVQLWNSHFYDFIPSNQFAIKWGTYCALCLLFVILVHVRYRHYTYRKPFWSELGDVFKLIILFSMFDLAICAFFKMPFSRITWGLNWALAFCFILIGRFGIRLILNQLGLWKKPAIIIGSGQNAKETFEALNAERSLGFKIEAYYPHGGQDDTKGSLSELSIIQNEAQLWHLIEPDTTQVILAFEHEETAEKELWLRRLEQHHCNAIYVIPAMRGVPLYSIDTSFLFSRELMFCRISNKISKLSARFMKRAFDIIASCIILILLSPLFLFLMFKVSRDGGSPIYGHERVGRGGKKFKCLKFRSMVLNSKEVLAQLLENDPEAKAEWEKDFKLKNDPRITKIGHFLRKTSLDELPQLWNVLKGEMSLVGPRPVIEEELLRYGDDVDYYLKVKPGMTGLWQVSGRSDTSYEMRVYFDAWYVKNWSMWNDIVILFKTVGVVLKNDGAY